MDRHTCSERQSGQGSLNQFNWTSWDSTHSIHAYIEACSYVWCWNTIFSDGPFFPFVFVSLARVVVGKDSYLCSLMRMYQLYTFHNINTSYLDSLTRKRKSIMARQDQTNGRGPRGVWIRICTWKAIESGQEFLGLILVPWYHLTMVTWSQ